MRFSHYMVHFSWKRFHELIITNVQPFVKSFFVFYTGSFSQLFHVLALLCAHINANHNLKLFLNPFFFLFS